MAGWSLHVTQNQQPGVIIRKQRRLAVPLYSRWGARRRPPTGTTAASPPPVITPAVSQLYKAFTQIPVSTCFGTTGSRAEFGARVGKGAKRKTQFFIVVDCLLGLRGNTAR